MNLLLLLLLLLSLAAAPASAADLLASVVTVVSVDDQGEPRRQGLGVAVGPDGVVLTSAAILAHSRGGLIKTGGGAMHFLSRVVRWDSLQDLAQVQAEGVGLPPVSVARLLALNPPEKVRVALRQGKALVLQEAQVTTVYPLSPRLVILHLAPAALAAEPGAPLFNAKGELVGMLHVLAGQGAPVEGLKFYLGLDPSLIAPPRKTPAPEEPRLEEILKYPPAGYHAAFWDGVGASLEKKWQLAEERFSLVLQYARDLPEAWYGRGVARYHRQDFVGAARDLKEAARLSPRYGLAFLWLGRAWQGLGKEKEARQAYGEAVTLTPELAEAWFQLGLMAYQAGNLGEAALYLEKMKGKPPQDRERWWYLGNIYRALRRQEDALEAYRKATEADPRYVAAYLEGGRLLLDLGRAPEAVTWLEKGVGLAPSLATLRYYLALAHLNTWNRARAWEEYFALQKLDPTLAASLAPLLEQSR
ncbi:MAG: serine protease [Deltaproteobacteria bacterium]|nr:serine protease [Deltaproteobacteria bacterium]